MAKDPYRYFRIEAHDLLEGLVKGVLALEAQPDTDGVRALLRYAHTLKGAARIVKQQDIAELAHGIEDVLGGYRGEGGPLAPDDAEKALALLDQMRSRLATLDVKPPVTPRAEPMLATSEESLRSVRVDVEQLDGLLEHILEGTAASTTLQRSDSTLKEARRLAHALVEELQGTQQRHAATSAERLLEVVEAAAGRVAQATGELRRELLALREGVSDLRLVPAHALTNDLQRAVRDAASAVGKDVSFSMTGPDVAIDANVLSGVRAALLHIVRNSVAHGIEDAAERERAKKGPRGSIELKVSRRGQRVVFTCHDDGGGLDVEGIRRAAINGGLVREADAYEMETPALIQLLLRGGVSTSLPITHVAGRGVGLDVVRDTIERLNGEVEIRTRSGAGTTVELLVPVSLSSMPALAVEVDGAAVLLPLDVVRTTIRLGLDDVLRSPDGDRLMIDDEALPYLPLSRLLSSASAASPHANAAVIIEAGRSRAAFGVDRIRDVRSVLVRDLPEHVESDSTVAGAAIGDDGVALLILAPVALVEAAKHARGAVDEPDVRPRPLPLLVIDDSLTTRMLEKSILESAGYEVDLAVSAEEALQKAKAARYAMFIVDVEMPGMNGFEFIATTRADPALKDIPSVLVTSRADTEDKRRGKEVGARGYIVKGDFDQRELLAMISRLVGQ